MALITRSVYTNKATESGKKEWICVSTDTYHGDSGSLYISLLANNNNLFLSPSEEKAGITKIIILNPEIPDEKIEYLISEQ